MATPPREGPPFLLPVDSRLIKGMTEEKGPASARSRKAPPYRRTRYQVRTLLDTISGDRLEALYVVAVTAGLRRGELQGLRWEDLDLSGATGTLQVRRTLSEPKGGYIFEAPKSGKGRNIRLTQRATMALRNHRKRQLVLCHTFVAP